MRIEAICKHSGITRFFETNQSDVYQRILSFFYTEYLAVIDDTFYFIFERPDVEGCHGYFFEILSAEDAAVWLLRSGSIVSRKIKSLLRDEFQMLTLGCIDVETTEVEDLESEAPGHEHQNEIAGLSLEELAKINPNAKVSWVLQSRILVDEYKNNSPKQEWVKCAKNWFQRDWERAYAETGLRWWQEFPDEIQKELHVIRRELLEIWKTRTSQRSGTNAKNL